MTALDGQPKLRHIYVEQLFYLNPADIGMGPDQTVQPTKAPRDEVEGVSTEEVEVTILQEDGGVLFAVSGAFRSHVQAVAYAEGLATSTLGDLGSNAAVAGLLRAVRVNSVDTGAYGLFLQAPRPNGDVPVPA